MSRLAQLVRPLQEAARIESRQFTVMLGLRAAAATFVPLILGAMSEHPSFHFAGIAGFVATTTDKGGAYATRARTFAALAVFSSFSVFLGSLVGHSVWLSVLVTFALVTSGALARVLGNEAISVGTVSSVLFLIAQATPSETVSQALQRGGINALGVAWAALLALVVWPVRQYAPARKAVAHAFEALANHIDEVARLLGAVGSRAWEQSHQRDHTAVRQAIERARVQLAAIRGNTRAITAKGAWLLGLVQTIDQTFGRVVALTDVLEGSAARGLNEAVRDELKTQLGEVSRACNALARFATDENEKAAVPRAEVQVGTLIALVNEMPREPLQRALLLHAAELLERIDHTLETVTPVTNSQPDAPASNWVTQLRSVLTFESIELRHALRVGVLVAVSIGVIGVLHIDHGYWATISMLVVLQPHAPATLQRSVQRVGGTILGSLLAVLIISFAPEPRTLLIISGVMAAVSVSVIQVNYALYATLLTPTFLLMAQINGTDSRLAGIRAGTTLAAGVIALIASRTLWPSTEKSRIADELVKTFGALIGLIRVTAKQPRATEAEINDARRRFGLAVSNADASFQRIVAERSASDAELEPVITLLLYLRRFCWSALAITTLPGALTLPTALADAFEAALLELQEALLERRAPRDLSSMGVDQGVLEPLLQGQVERLVQHLQVMHAAERRFVFHSPTATPLVALKKT